MGQWSHAGIPHLNWQTSARALPLNPRHPRPGLPVPQIRMAQDTKAGSSLPLRVAGDYPPLGPRRQLLTVSMTGQPAACPTVVFLKTGPDSYLPYDLLGGP